uniref:Uncharacterized protein n=1 Tax=Zea mays TaxID=4577 RepID=B6U805_MAIZE|nr:hypothetical protein [Zea mays]
MTELFDTAVTSLLHLPEVLDRLAAADGDRRSAGHHAAHGHGHGHGHGRVHGLGGGGAPVDIVESPRAPGRLSRRHPHERLLRHRLRSAVFSDVVNFPSTRVQSGNNT